MLNASDRCLDRRNFLKKGVLSASVLGTATLISKWPFAASAADSNAFAYDLRHLAKTDPKLVRYREISRARCPHENARRIAVGPDDRAYVASGNYVSRLDAEGKPQFELALPSSPSGLALTYGGELIIALREHIEVFDAKGQRRNVWGSAGTRAWLTGLVATAQGVFAADAGQRVILHYDMDGKLLRRIGEKNKERNIPGFIVPSPFFDVEMHRDGLLRVGNPGRHRVEAYTVEGDFEFSWGKASAAIDGFCGCCNPIALAVLPDGRLVTCEKGLPRVKVYRADGSFDGVVAGPEAFPENAKVTSDRGGDCNYGGLDAAVDSQGRVYILDLVTAEVRVMVEKTMSGA